MLDSLRIAGGRLAARALKAITPRLDAPRVIYGRDGHEPYLSRYDLAEPREGELEQRPWHCVLHYFHRSDDAGELHSHPWEWAVSLVLSGGYLEERRIGDRVIRRRVLPGSINLLSSSTYHRVDLLEQGAWTLFVMGPKLPTWWFWNRDTLSRCRWELYCAARVGRGSFKWISDRREARP